jgi:hypothetical protein
MMKKQEHNDKQDVDKEYLDMIVFNFNHALDTGK